MRAALFSRAGEREANSERLEESLEAMIPVITVNPINKNLIQKDVYYIA
jgi:hypothetical protein